MSEFPIAVQNAIIRRLAARSRPLTNPNGKVLGATQLLGNFEVLNIRLEEAGDRQSLALVVKDPAQEGIRIGFKWDDILGPDIADYVHNASSVEEAAEAFVTLFLANFEERLDEENFGLQRPLSPTKINWV